MNVCAHCQREHTGSCPVGTTLPGLEGTSQDSPQGDTVELPLLALIAHADRKPPQEISNPSVRPAPVTSDGQVTPRVQGTPQAARNHDQSLRPGTPVGEYQVLEMIGFGGMGTVYSGVHPLIGKKVAIKVLNPEFAQSTLVSERFIQEARAVNQIGHPNIVDIFGFGRLPDGRQFFIMELLTGQSLRQRMSSQALSPEEMVPIISQMCDALSAAHKENIVHRDLKPDNIFLAQTKSGQVTKLLDFGVAKLLDRGGADHTSVGMSVGTPRYMSPEQCLGDPIDNRSDIYSLGVILFSLFTGQMPFPGSDYLSLVNAHICQQPPRPSSLAPIPGPLEVLILQCLEKDPKARPATVEEVKQRLLEILSKWQGAATVLWNAEAANVPRPGASAIAAGMAMAAAAKKKPPRSRPGLWAGAGLALTLIAVGLVYVPKRSRSKTERQAAEDAEGSTSAPKEIQSRQPSAHCSMAEPGLFRRRSRAAVCARR